jgi:hypothetical protein
MFQGIVKTALPAAAAVWFIAMTATSAPAFTLSAPSLDKPVAASNVEKTYYRYGWRGGGWGWRRPWGYGYGWRRPWGYGYGWHRRWGYGYGWHRPWGYGYGWHRRWGYGYGWHRPWGYGWRYRGW